MSPSCPRDGEGLLASATKPGSWHCTACQGLLRKDSKAHAGFARDGVDATALGRMAPGPPACPFCLQPMRSRLIEGIGIHLCEGCEALWLDAGERKKFEAYLKDPDRMAAFRPVATGKPGEDVYSDYGVFAGLRDFLLGLSDFFAR